MDEETKNRLFAELFPLPADVPRRTLRFGSIAAAADLPQSELMFDRNPSRVPLMTTWDDAGLGLRFMIREQKDGEVVASVDSDDAALAGKTVSLSLFGDDADRQVGKRILLSSDPEGGSTGRASFGSINELVKTLGKSVQPTYFLVELPQ